VRNATLAVKRGEAVYERDGVVFDEIEYSWPALSALLWVASRNQGKLHVLDFGGALGSSYFQNRRFLSGITNLRWNVVEQPHFVAVGNQEVADGRLRFFGSIDDCLKEERPSVMLLSSALQYLESPHNFLRDVRGKFPFIIVDLTPVHTHDRDRLTVQKVPAHIYPASYRCWVFSEKKLLATLEEGYRLVESFDCALGQELATEGVSARYRGYVLEAGMSRSVLS